MSPDDTDVLIAAIRAAFGGVQPGAISLHEAEVIDGYGTDEERAAARLRDPEHSWQDVPDDSVVDCQWALPHLDPEGWRFYLPVYMIWTLRHPDTPSAVQDFTVYALTPSDDDRIRAYQFERYVQLSDRQCAAVCGFLRFMTTRENVVDDASARKALSEHWGKFCGSGDA